MTSSSYSSLWSTLICNDWNFLGVLEYHVRTCQVKWQSQFKLRAGDHRSSFISWLFSWAHHIFSLTGQHAAEFGRARWKLEHVTQSTLSRALGETLPTGPPCAHFVAYWSPEGDRKIFQSHQFVINLERELDYLENGHEKKEGIRTIEVWANLGSTQACVFSAYSQTGRQESWQAGSQARERV